MTHAVLAVATILCAGAAFGQVRISGQLVDANGTPAAGHLVNLRDAKNAEKTSSVTTNQDGVFSFEARDRVEYLLYAAERQPYSDVAIQTADLKELHLGRVVLRDKLEVTGPIRIKQARQMPIAAVYCVSGGSAHVVLGNGNEVQPLADKEQVGCKRPAISETGAEAGWLASYDFCCTSSPISRELVVFRPDKPVRRLKGDERAIFDWRFIDDGKRVAFYQDFLHGTAAHHYELRDVETGRLIDEWNAALDEKAPKWTRGMQQ